jgi:hypothetical protein
MSCRRHKGRSTPAAKHVAFRTFGDVRPLLTKYVLPVYGDPDGPPFEIVCDTMDVALALKERITEADQAEAFRAFKGEGNPARQGVCGGVSRRHAPRDNQGTRAQDARS